MTTIILSQWYREAGSDFEYYKYWRAALRKFAPGIPILVVHNGGPTDPPYDDVEIVPAVEMEQHGRGSPGHYRNCWRSMCHGFQILEERGIDLGIFIGQHLVVGNQFVAACEISIQYADLLWNVGCLQPSWAHTEYMAANPKRCHELWWRRPLDGHLEGRIVDWARDHRLRVSGFPGLWKQRDTPPSPGDTAFFHSDLPNLKVFAENRGIII